MNPLSMFQTSRRARKHTVRKAPELGEEILASLALGVPKSEQQGFALAEDCMNNWLRQGRSLKLSEITARIRSTHKSRTGEIESAFLRRMLAYIGCHEIGQMRAHDGEMVLVHNDLLRG